MLIKFDLLRILRGKEKAVLESIRDEKKINSETEKKLKTIISKLTEEYVNKAK
jgi:hypothetical protein